MVTMLVQISLIRVVCRILIGLLLLRAGGCTPLYPYSHSESIRLDDTHNRDLPFPFPVHFYGFVFQSAMIKNFGAITFDLGDGSPSLDSYYDVQWDDSHRDVYFMAPFYMNTEQPDDISKIYIEHINATTNKTFLLEMDDYLDAMVVSPSDISGTNIGKFASKFVTIITWERLTSVIEYYSSANCRRDRNTCKRNTFQVVLIANENRTFAIFNYDQVKATEQHDQIGFYGGKMNSWTDGGVPTKAVAGSQWSDVYGRLVFEIGNDVIKPGGCQGPLTTASSRPLVAYPENGGSYGGTVVVVQGVCMEPADDIQCDFGGVTSPGAYSSQTKAFCFVPRLLTAGIIDLTVSVTRNGRTHTATTKFTINVQSIVGFDLRVTNNNQTVPEHIRLEWNPDILSVNDDATLDLNLYGYREGDKVDWSLVRTLGSGIRNSDGHYEFSPADYRCHGNTCSDFEMGTFELIVQNKSQASSSYAISIITPFGWFVNSYMTENHGASWPYAKCDAWYKKEKEDMSWNDALINCPCTLDQALLDFGRFQPDPSCNMFAGSVCAYHKGAVHCVRTVVPRDKAGNQCCYKADGLLRFSEDSYQGSTPDKSHTWGARPYMKPGHVPNFSHWLEDVITFYYCCLWVDYKDCDKYMEVRATRDCSGYMPPKTAVAFGDPHIGTFDGITYNFGGKGDFVILRAKSFELQGKFVQLPSQFGTRQSTAIVAVALTDPTDSISVLEFRIRSENADRMKRSVDVLVDNHYVYFDKPGMALQDFDGFAVSYADSRQMHSNFTVMMHSGIGLQVAETSGLLQVKCNVPHEYMDDTVGLFGTYDDNKENEFTTPKLHITPRNANDTTVYKSFGLSWKVQAQDASLFRNFDPADESFTPIFEPDSMTSHGSVSADNVAAVCGANKQCAFDFYVTGDKQIAMSSRTSASWFAEAEVKLHATKSCGLLSVPHSIKDSYNYSLGNTITITGCRDGYTLEGQQMSYTCGSPDGHPAWTPDVDVLCAVPTGIDTSEIGMIAGIAVGSVAAVLCAMVMLCVVRKRLRKSSNKDPIGDKRTSEPIVQYRDDAEKN